VAAQALRSLLEKLAARPRPGAAGEDLACRHLESHGFAILARNFRCRSGEVDVVAQDADATVVFVEVKERHGASHGAGYEAVTFGKRRRVIRAARLFAAARGLSEDPIRFDVISIDWTQDGRCNLRHDRSAFDASGL
jgi:putative endonuclease